MPVWHPSKPAFLRNNNPIPQFPAFIDSILDANDLFCKNSLKSMIRGKEEA